MIWGPLFYLTDIAEGVFFEHCETEDYTILSLTMETTHYTHTHT